MHAEGRQREREKGTRPPEGLGFLATLPKASAPPRSANPDAPDADLLEWAALWCGHSEILTTVGLRCGYAQGDGNLGVNRWWVSRKGRPSATHTGESEQTEVAATEM